MSLQSASPFPPGAKIGPYTVVEQLGSGGMGVVLRVTGEAGRELALKLLLRAATPEARARFTREGELVAALKHQGIVGIHSAGTHDDRPYLVYELVEGADLDSRLPELTRPERLRVIHQVALALGYAHDQGVVHRDVKPANILIGAGLTATVADFGIAQAAGLERLTQTGALVGTPQCMAPEQIAGRAEDYGAHTDVWALGVLLYRALTDSVPFPGGTLTELMAQVVSANPRPPIAHDSSIPRAIQGVCLKALEKSPKDRYPHGNAFAAALEEAIHGDVAKGAQTRNRVLIAAATILCAGSAAAAGFTLVQPAAPSPVATREGVTKIVKRPPPLSPRLEAALAAAAKGAPQQALTSLRRVADSLQQRPELAERLDALRLARTQRARKLRFDAADLPLELELLGLLVRCRARGVPAGAELAAEQEALLAEILEALTQEIESGAAGAEAGNATLSALSSSGIALSDSTYAAAAKLSDAYVSAAQFRVLTGRQYLEGLVALARLNVGLEQSHLVLHLSDNPLTATRAWLGAPSQDPVRRAVQLLIQIRPEDAEKARSELRGLLAGTPPAWPPRLRARVLEFVAQDEASALAVSRIGEAQRLDPRWPRPLVTLSRARLRGTQPALALKSAEQALAQHLANGDDTRFATRWETSRLRALAVEVLAALERYEEAGKRLDALIDSRTNPSALLHLQVSGVIALLERELGRTFEWDQRMGPR